MLRREFSRTLAFKGRVESPFDRLRAMSFVEWRRSELALSEVEGVNPEQLPAACPEHSRRIRLGGRRVDSMPLFLISNNITQNRRILR